MISPSPSPEHDVAPAQLERKVVAMTPIRKRVGQTPAALFVKALFRPIFKGLYYLLQGIKHHKLVTLLALLLFFGGAIFTNSILTKTLPFSIGAADPLQGLTQHDQASGNNVRNWLYALRDGDASTMIRMQQGLIMPTPPDQQQLIGMYSKDHIVWKDISVLSVIVEPDTTIDAFIKVNVVAPGQNGNANAAMIWHFATLPQQAGRVLTIELVSSRQLLQ